MICLLYKYVVLEYKNWPWFIACRYGRRLHVVLLHQLTTRFVPCDITHQNRVQPRVAKITILSLWFYDPLNQRKWQCNILHGVFVELISLVVKYGNKPLMAWLWFYMGHHNCTLGLCNSANSIEWMRHKQQLNLKKWIWKDGCHWGQFAQFTVIQCSAVITRSIFSQILTIDTP